jgi:hypothetical protein
MFRVFTRIGALVAVVAAALAFSGSALANPSTPILAPIPPTVFEGPLTISWSPSVFDRGAQAGWYELTLIDITAGTSSKTGHFGTSKTVNVFAGHTYGVRVRAGEVTSGNTLVYSPSSVDVFNVIKFFEPPLYRYDTLWRLKPNPCLTCPPFEIFVGDDPVVQRTRELVSRAQVVDREQLLGLYVDARGEVSAILG